MAFTMTLTCEQCGAQFSKPPSSRSYAKSFCSMACYTLFRRRGKLDAKGYVVASWNGRYIKEHRRVMQEHLNRTLLPIEDIHHINGNKTDNRIENLQLIDHRDHAMHHKRPKWNLALAAKLLADGVALREISRRLNVPHQNIKRTLRTRGYDID